MSINVQEKFSKLVAYDIHNYEAIDRLVAKEKQAKGNFSPRAEGRDSLGYAITILCTGLKFPKLMLKLVKEEQYKQINDLMPQLDSLTEDSPMTATRYVAEAYEQYEKTGKAGILIYSRPDNKRTTYIKRWSDSDTEDIYSEGFHEAIWNINTFTAQHIENVKNLRRLTGYTPNNEGVWNDTVKGIGDWESVFDYYHEAVYNTPIVNSDPTRSVRFAEKRESLKAWSRHICLDNKKNFLLQFNSVRLEPNALRAVELVNKAIHNTIAN